MKSFNKKTLVAVFWVGLLIAYAVYSKQTGTTPFQHLRTLTEFLNRSPWGPLLFIGVYILRPILLFSAALLTIAGGAIFGPVWGLVYVLIGSNCGASLAFFIGRFFGQDLLDSPEQNGEADSAVQKYIQRMQDNSFETVFLMRLMFLPYDLVNYMAGFLKINFGAFLLATILGSIPGTISFTLFGASTGLSAEGPKFDPRVLAASVAIFLVSLAISRALKNREQAQSENEKAPT